MNLNLKSRGRSRPWLPVLLAVAVGFGGAVVLGCSVPVFRYALERWTPDAYHLALFYRGGLSEADKALVGEIGTGTGVIAGLANAHTRLIDLDQDLEPGVRDLWSRQKSDHLPWLVVVNPKAGVANGTIWSGPLSAEAVNRLVDSPIRREIGARLVSGQTAVWVCLESGDAGKDAEAFDRLESRLKELETELKIQELDPQDIAKGLVSVTADALKVSFSVVRLSRQDPEEALFVNMLLETEEDLREFDEPMVFPVFGQGRALYALIGEGIQRSTIDEAASFLVGPCSCEVKEQNPGVDLLLSIDWSGRVVPMTDQDRELPALTGLAGLEDSGESPASEEPDVKVSELEIGQRLDGDPELEAARVGVNPVVRNSILAVALIGLGVLGGGWLFVRGR